MRRGIVSLLLLLIAFVAVPDARAAVVSDSGGPSVQPRIPMPEDPYQVIRDNFYTFASCESFRSQLGPQW